MKFLLTVLITLLLTACSSGSAEVYQQGVVYVIYSRDGASSVKADDVDQNGVPDVVEDIATQINAAREVFHDEFGFPDPLGSQRYKNVKTVEVDIVLKKDMGNHNGLAYSGVRNKSKHNPNESALHVNVATSVDPRKNATPAHEYFHLIQYGETYFKNSWYLEGMARWAQDSIEQIKKYPSDKNFPRTLDNKASEDQIFGAKYKAANLLWYPMSVELKDKAKIPGKIMKKYKYVDGSPVFKDDVFYGPNVMRQVLAALPDGEKLAVEEYGDQKKWRKDGIRKDQNNKYILDCVRKVYDEQK